MNTNIQYLLTITTDWISVVIALIAAFIGGIGIAPIINKYWKQRKIPKEKKMIIEDQKRQLETLPFFVIHKPSVQSNTITMIKLRNTGSKAKGLMVVIPFMNDGRPSSIKIDKHEIEKNEAVTITIIANLLEPIAVPVYCHISYFDIDGRRYQQSYSKNGLREDITSSEWLVNRATL